MQAEFSAELGTGDRVLKVPWGSSDVVTSDSSDSAPNDSMRYFDLRAQPELLLNISEAHHNRPLGEFLSALNSPASRLQTSKCDTWRSTEISEAEQMFGASCKYASYIDLFFADETPRYSLPRHEEFAESLCTLLGKAPEISAAAQIVVRRCHFHDDTSHAVAREGGTASQESRTGFSLTFNLTGYGDDDEEALKRWCIGLKLVENAILQLAAKSRV